MSLFQVRQDFSINSGNRSWRNRTKTLGTVFHETATPRATAKAEMNYFRNNVVKASVHGFIDDVEIVHCLPFPELCWGAGPTANSQFIQVELCHFDNSPEKFFNIWRRAVWWFAQIHIMIGVTTITNRNCMSHYECSKVFRDTDHVDPVGYFAQYGKTVDDFRHDVQQEINAQMRGGSFIVQQWEIDALNWARTNGILANDHDPDEVIRMNVMCQMFKNFFENTLKK